MSGSQGAGTFWAIICRPCRPCPLQVHHPVGCSTCGTLQCSTEEFHPLEKEPAPWISDWLDAVHLEDLRGVFEHGLGQ